MAKEIPDYMPDEIDSRLPESSFSSKSLDSGEKINLLARKFCEPSEEIYKNSPELARDPFAAIKAVDWHGPSVSEIDDPVDGLLIGAAKLDVAADELNLSPKQRKHFLGVKKNIDGAIGFLGTLRDRAQSKAVRAIASGATIVGMTLGAAGCGNALARPVDGITPNTPSIVEVSPTPFEPSTPINPTLTVSPKPTEILLVSEGAPYPKNADNLIRTPSISGTEARNKIIKYGTEEDLKALETWYKKTGVLKAGSSNFLVPVAYEENGNFFWNAMVKSGNGEFIKFTLTGGPEEGELVRDMGMVNYLDTQPSFESSYLSDPPGLAGLNQQIIWDKSGWSVVGAFQGDNLIAWFNADAPNGGEWVKIQELVPTPTQEVIEIPFDMSRPETIDAIDGNSYQGYLIEDEFGTRLVDETNTIILVKEDNSWKPAESRNYSEEYPAVYWETKIGHADGFEMPITLGLARNVREGVGFNFSEVHMTQLGADSVASNYLSDAWFRYRIVMNHPDTTYEDYLELLKEGKGNFSVYDAIEKKDILVDPRQGVSFVITGDRTKSMPIWKLDVIGVYFDADQGGRLLVATSEAYQYHSLLEYKDNYRDINVRTVQFAVGSTGMLSYYPNRCFKSGSVDAVCSDIEEPFITADESHSTLPINYVLFDKHESDDPLFILK